MDRRTVFFVSDQTGVTAETMGHSLLTQFDGGAFRQVTLPFISTVDKAEEAVRRINATGAAEGVRPVIFSTLVQEDMREIICATHGAVFDPPTGRCTAGPCVGDALRRLPLRREGDHIVVECPDP